MFLTSYTTSGSKVVGLLILLVSLLSACNQQPGSLVVYSGKGIKHAVDEIAERFGQQSGAEIKVVYAGSKTLLDTIQKTNQGDIFIPGSEAYIKDAGDLISNSRFAAYHVPTFAIAAQQSTKLRTFEDLQKPGVRIAVGNKRMAAIGRLSDNIISNSLPDVDLGISVVVTASTVNELLELVASNEVDAALVWKDMLNWEIAGNLTEVSIPEAYYESQRILVSTLSTATNNDLAEQFLEYATSPEGQLIFEKHGFAQ